MRLAEGELEDQRARRGPRSQHARRPREKRDLAPGPKVRRVQIPAQMRARAAARWRGPRRRHPAPGRGSAPPSPPPRARRSRGARGAPGPRSRSRPRRAPRSRELGDLAPQRMAISSTIASVPGSASRTVSGSPISVLRFSRLAWVVTRAHQAPPGCPSWRSCRSSRSRPHPRPELATPGRARQAAERPQRVGRHDRGRGRARRLAGGALRSLGGGAMLGPTTTTQAPISSASGGERALRPAVSPGSPTKRSPGPTSRESITARPARRARRRHAASSPSASGGDAGRARVDHAAHPGSSARSASRATVTSSNGSLRPPSNSWPCS